MLDAIAQHPELSGICGCACQENNVSVEICDDLLVNSELDHARIKVLKVDQYYNTRRFARPPKSIDCLIIVKCQSGTYRLTLAELRDVSSTRGVKPKDILQKFTATFTQFMQEDFPEIFANDKYAVSSVQAWLVVDPFNASQLSDAEYKKKMRGTVLDVIQSQKPFRVGNHAVLIKHMRPNPVLCTC
jgi:hypothetical protein